MPRLIIKLTFIQAPKFVQKKFDWLCLLCLLLLVTVCLLFSHKVRLSVLSRHTISTRLCKYISWDQKEINDCNLFHVYSFLLRRDLNPFSLSFRMDWFPGTGSVWLSLQKNLLKSLVNKALTIMADNFD